MSRRSHRGPNTVVKLPAERKRHRLAIMLPTITSLFCGYSLFTWPRQQTRAAEDQHVFKLCNVSTVGSICFDNGNSPKVRSNGAAPRRIIFPLHAKRCFTTPALMRAYVGRTSIPVLQKRHGFVKKIPLNKFRSMSQQWRYDYRGSDWSLISRLVSNNARRCRPLPNRFLTT